MSEPMPLPATFAELIKEHGGHQPCCTFVARALRRSRGLDDDPAYAEVGTVDGEASWWSRSQIWDADQPWSGVDAALELGGHLVEVLGRGWTKVQVWTLVYGHVDVSRGSRGHDFFVQVRTDGTQVIYESDEGKGYRRREMTLEERVREHADRFGGEVVWRGVGWR
jgi:hypothetical protein